MTEAAMNTDREIWRAREGDAYADRIHVTKEGAIGIDCGGYVIVKPVREWHALASAAPSPDGEEVQRVARAIQETAYCATGHPSDDDGAYIINPEEVARAAISAMRPAQSDSECHCPEHGSWVLKADQDKLVRELDVLLNGEYGAAKQASLCDIVGQVAREQLSLYRGPHPATLSEEDRARMKTVAEEIRGYAGHDAPWLAKRSEELLSLIDKLTNQEPTHE